MIHKKHATKGEQPMKDKIAALGIDLTEQEINLIEIALVASELPTENQKEVNKLLDEFMKSREDWEIVALTDLLLQHLYEASPR